MSHRILLVDDDNALRQFLESALLRRSYDVVTSATPEEALKILEKEHIQVIFLDLNMPGMNGVELCRRIRQDNPIACIHAMTGYTSLFELAECREAGFDDYFTKPLDLNDLFQTIEHAFQKLDRWKKR